MGLHVEGWIAQARSLSIAAAAVSVGLSPGRGGSFGPCPSCNAEQRGSSDKRGPIGLNADQTGWRCHKCGATGDVVDLVAYSTAGKRLAECSKEQQRKVVDWFKSQGQVNANTEDPVLVSTPKPREKLRPPRGEVKSFWMSTAPVTNFAAVCEFLVRRQFDPSLVERVGFIRVTQPYPHCESPSWWPKQWTRDYRLVTPAYDHKGNFVSIHARAVKDTKHGKTRWPKGYEAGGLFMGNKSGVMLLKQKPVSNLRGLLICEGMTDLLRASTCALQSELALAVIAGASGSFQHLSKVQLPPELPIYTATDTDEAGSKYLSLIRKSLKSHQIRPLNLSV